MKQGWRRAFATFAVLLLITLVILIRNLDADRLTRSIRLDLQHELGVSIHTGTPSPGLLHIAGLRIRNVDIRPRDGTWHLHVDAMRMELSVWSLLRGKVNVRNIDMIRPTLTLPRLPHAGSIPLPYLPESLRKVRLLRGSLLVAGAPLASDMAIVLRQVGRERELNWEIQARLSGGDLVSQGRIRNAGREHGTVFGKLTAMHVHLPRLPEMRLLSPAYNTLDAALTFDVDAGNRWQLSGDATLYATNKRMPRLAWRGKMDGEGLHHFSWHDAFLHLGRNTMAAIHGGCTQGRGCSFKADAKKAGIALLLKAAGLDYPAGGNMDVRTSLTRRHRRWHARADIVLHHFAWSDIAVPDMILAIPELVYRSADDFEATGIRLRPTAGHGGIELTRLRRNGETWQLDAEINSLDKGWPPLANIMLKLHGLKSRLKGGGSISASMHMSYGGHRALVGFSVDAGPASIDYADQFKKPAGIHAVMAGRAWAGETGTTVLIRKMVLGNSQIEHARWTGEPGSASVESFRINLSGLQKTGIRLPHALQDLHGTVSGRFSHVQPAATTGLTDWFYKSEADLRLQSFGTENSTWDGALRIRQGRLATPGMLWRRGAHHARLDGHIRLVPMQGLMNIRNAALVWKAGSNLPAWLTRADLHGSLHAIELNWLGNTWHGIRGTYRTRAGSIALTGVHAGLAGGSIESRKMVLTPEPDGIRFEGPVRLTIVRPGELQGLAEALGANIDGYMYLNARLRGELPWRRGSGWHGNGDIEIQYGHWRPNDPKLFMALGGAHTETGSALAFSRFTARFHLLRNALRLAHIRLKTRDTRITGDALVHPDGSLNGIFELRAGEKKRTVGLSGNWPALGRLAGATR